MGTSIQQTSQIGTEERRGRGEPQRAQPEGRKAQLAASSGLRRTRATARHVEVLDGTSNVSEPESLRKTHLTGGEAIHPPHHYLYPFRSLVARLRALAVPLQAAIRSELFVRLRRQYPQIPAFGLGPRIHGYKPTHAYIA